NPVNIGNPVETSILEFAEIINMLADGKEIVFEPDKRGSGDPQRRRPDITRAETILDWHPKVSLRDGLERTIPYFREQMKLR
ncbi:MAG: SDR family NAD-dependent epimerase/dehydratase, partial [Chloroflexi bacterium]|nr:SDR family NAD-dependent epimerase/dehydratase [Chloroflexota bacterium]